MKSKSLRQEKGTQFAYTRLLFFSQGSIQACRALSTACDSVDYTHAYVNLYRWRSALLKERGSVRNVPWIINIMISLTHYDIINTSSTSALTDTTYFSVLIIDSFLDLLTYLYTYINYLYRF